MKKEDDIIHSLIMGGAIVGGLATLLIKDKRSNPGLVGLAVAAILSSYKARENAFKTNIPVLVEEDHALYEVHSDGTRKFIKNLPVSSIQIPDTFILE